MSPRKRISRPLCGDCRAPIRWLQLRGAWRPFEPDAGTNGPASAYPVEGRTAWLPGALASDLQRRFPDMTRTEAEGEVADHDWHAVHVCRRRDDDAYTSPQHDNDDQEDNR